MFIEPLDSIKSSNAIILQKENDKMTVFKFRRFKMGLAVLLCCSAILLSFNVSAVSPKDSNQEGTTLSYSDVQSLPDGGYAYNYYIDGVKNSLLVPPDNFKPLNATDAQLKEYGFPTRPTDQTELANWKSVMGAYKESAGPGLVLMNDTADIDASTTSETSKNWAGYVSKVSSNKYTKVEGEFKQPTYISGSSWALECSWVGLGGHGTKSLVQAGTVMISGSTYKAWYEYLSSNSAYKISMTDFDDDDITVSEDNYIYIYVYYDTSENIAYFSLDNTTTGKSVCMEVSFPSSICYDGTSAEWIDERPKNNSTNTYHSLADFGSNTWNGCYAYDGSSWNSLGSLAYTAITMTSDGSSSGTKLSAPGSLISNTSFKDVWYAAS